MNRFLKEIPIDAIVESDNQPRKIFNQNKIEELAKSILENGLLQPITVEVKDNRYQLVAGERRLRAFKYLGYIKIPAIVAKFDNKKSAVLGLIENIQRENLSPIEEAYSYQNLMQLQSVNQTQLAKQLGKSQSSIANKLRLLNLPIEIMNEIDNKKITERHGRALLALKDEPGLMLKMARQISENDLTVVKTEIQIKKIIHDAQQTNINSKTRIIEDNNVKIKLAVNTIKKSIANPIDMIKATGLNIDVIEKKIGAKHQIIIEIEEK